MWDHQTVSSQLRWSLLQDQLPASTALTADEKVPHTANLLTPPLQPYLNAY